MIKNLNGEQLFFFLLIFWWLVPPIALLVFVAGVIVSVICTICSVIALFKPFIFYGWPFRAEYSIIYFRDSLRLAFAIPVIVYACEIVYGISIDANVYLYTFIFGYVFGGLGEIAWDEFNQKFLYESPSYSAPRTTTPAAQGKQELLPPPSSSYRYANWDDEEERR